MTLVNYTSIEIRENNEPMVELENLGLLVDPQYFQQGLSTSPRMFLRETVAQKLIKVQKSLGKNRLKIWDAFRSRDTQNNIYQKYWVETKIAHPDWSEEELKIEVGKFISPPYQKDRIPPHTTGGAVDLTLADEKGRELDMGTKFDFFGPEAEASFYDIYKNNSNIANNRKMLRKAMEAEGFTLYEDEWWHFDYGNQLWALKSGKPFAFYGEVNEDSLSKS